MMKNLILELKIWRFFHDLLKHDFRNPYLSTILTGSWRCEDDRIKFLAHNDEEPDFRIEDLKIFFHDLL